MGFSLRLPNLSSWGKDPLGSAWRTVTAPHRAALDFVTDPTGEKKRALEEQKRVEAQNAALKQTEQQRLDSQRKQLQNEAYDFEKQLPTLKKEKYLGLLGDYSQNLAEGKKKLKEGFNRRGLLYSGLRAGEEGGFESGLRSQLSSGKFGINRELEDISRAKKQAAAQVGLEGAGQALQRAEELYNMQMQNQIARQRAMEQLTSGVGYGIGSYLGYQGNQQQGLLKEEPYNNNYFVNNYLAPGRTPESRGLNRNVPGASWTGNYVA